jgi:superfamily II DNA or RNA helicase
MLRDLKLKAVYRTDEDNLLEDFYIPALSVGISYQRAVGYFSAAMLSCAAQGLSAFVANEGKMQLVVGGELDVEDEQAIRLGYDIRQVSDRLGIKIVNMIASISDALCYRRLEALSWLVATGRLNIKVALRKRGMYHEKIGIIRDAEGDAVVFQGSANETLYALLPDFNFESINVFPCWREELSAHFTPYLRGFDRLWSNQTKDTLVLDFPEAATKALIKIAEKCRVPKPVSEIFLARPRDIAGEGVEAAELAPALPTMLGDNEFAMQPHQLAALNAWKANALQGILAHATGSGKTITALYGAVRLFDATKRLALIVAVPYQTLAEQWVAVMEHFHMSAIRCYGSRNAWYAKLSEQMSLFCAGAMPFLCVVVVNRTLQSDEFQKLLGEVPGDRLMWVGDECHHHATVALASALPRQAQMRLGLSATPEHYINIDATERLKGYYGNVVSEFTLEDALRAGVITPYDYHVSVVSLTESEAQEYLEISEQISVLTARRGDSNVDVMDDEQLKALLMSRARILGSATEKVSALRQLLSSRRPEPLTLFYCGDGSTEDEDSGESIRSIDQVSTLLYEWGWKCAQFTARESRDEREDLLSAFRIGAVDALVAIRCLDEGIDVPGCRTAYILASGRNPKQFIQRRGRILRKAPGKDHATIYDFLVRLPADELQVSPFERKLVAGELARVAEFAKLARNSLDAVRSLMPVLAEYDLAHALA